MMKLTVMCQLLMAFLFSESVLCGRNILMHGMNENQLNEIGYQKSVDSEFALNAEKLLHRNKRYLLFTNGGISKVSNHFSCDAIC